MQIFLVYIWLQALTEYFDFKLSLCTESELVSKYFHCNEFSFPMIICFHNLTKVWAVFEFSFNLNAQWSENTHTEK